MSYSYPASPDYNTRSFDPRNWPGLAAVTPGMNHNQQPLLAATANQQGYNTGLARILGGTGVSAPDPFANSDLVASRFMTPSQAADRRTLLESQARMRATPLDRIRARIGYAMGFKGNPMDGDDEVAALRTEMRQNNQPTPVSDALRNAAVSAVMSNLVSSSFRNR